MTDVRGIESSLETNDAPKAASNTLLSLPQHTRLLAVSLEDRTDRCNELVHVQRWLLHPSEKLQLNGNLFVFENMLDGSGNIAMKLAPLPAARGVQSQWDLRVFASQEGYTAELFDDQTYPWNIIAYAGGQLGRTRAVQQAQRQLMSETDINFMSNTWGDRSRDSRMNEAFILDEIKAAARLGVEIVQLDDGWQRGRTSNSVEAQSANGRWEGFHNGDVPFWTPDPVRFPHGLEPIIQAAAQHQVAIGLWYAPDSADDFAKWADDVKTVIQLHQRYGVCHLKFDSINARSRTGEVHLNQFFDAINQQSQGRIVVDLDITAGRRPGYFGRVDCGPLFVTNRYTDWHNYWPHQVLRNLWQLSAWIAPIRLRMIFLNHARNTALYANDPLAPQQIAPATMFAPLMFCQPLGWFEIANLPESYFQQVKPLVELWKQHRHAIHDGTILPVGLEPDGVAWSGFLSLADDHQAGYLLICNGMQTSINLSRDLPSEVNIRRVKQLAGQGRLECKDSLVQLTHLPPQSFWFGTFDECRLAGG